MSACLQPLSNILCHLIWLQPYCRMHEILDYAWITDVRNSNIPVQVMKANTYLFLLEISGAPGTALQFPGRQRLVAELMGWQWLQRQPLVPEYHSSSTAPRTATGSMASTLDVTMYGTWSVAHANIGLSDSKCMRTQIMRLKPTGMKITS